MSNDSSHRERRFEQAMKHMLSRIGSHQVDRVQQVLEN